jgi:hypothetical protein
MYAFKPDPGDFTLEDAQSSIKKKLSAGIRAIGFANGILKSLNLECVRRARQGKRKYPDNTVIRTFDNSTGEGHVAYKWGMSE